jgi:hypothetical protein
MATSAVEIRTCVFTGGMLGAPAKLGRQLGNDKVIGYASGQPGGQTWLFRCCGLGRL